MFVAVESPAAAGSGEPALYTTPGGVTFLSWVEPAGEDVQRMRFSRWTGAGWSAARTIAEGDGWFVNWADVPMLVADDNGWMAAAYLQKTAPDTYAYGVRITQSSDGGASWSAAVTPHVTGAPRENESASFARDYRGDADVEHGFVSMVPMGDGVRLVWLDGWKTTGEKPEMTVLAGHITRDGKARRPIEIDARACDCCPTAAVPVAGGIVVAYRDRSSKEVRDIRVSRWHDGAWSNTWRSDDGWAINGCPVNGPAMDAAGDTVSLAWFTMPDDVAAVNVVHSLDGGATFGKAVRVDDGSSLGRVDLVSVPGGAIVCWLETVGEAAEIRARFVPVAGSAGPSATITPSSAKRRSGYPRITETGGLLIAAWTDVSGEEPIVRTAVASRAAVPTHESHN